jgi:hypothetical protein
MEGYIINNIFNHKEVKMVVLKRLLLPALLCTAVTVANASFEEWMTKASLGRGFSEEELSRATDELFGFSDAQLTTLRAALESATCFSRTGTRLVRQRLINADDNAALLWNEIGALLDKDIRAMIADEHPATPTAPSVEHPVAPTAPSPMTRVQRLMNFGRAAWEYKIIRYPTYTFYVLAHIPYFELLAVDACILAHKYGIDAAIIESVKSVFSKKRSKAVKSSERSEAPSAKKPRRNGGNGSASSATNA